MKESLTLAERLRRIGPWTAPALPEDLPHGDMPGDKIVVGEDHIRKAQLLFPRLLEALGELEGPKAVVSVFGGSGVGKSEIASLLAWYLRSAGIGSYVISGDNYPRRIPLYNDAERLSIFRAAGLRGLLAEGLYSPDLQKALDVMWPQGLDADASYGAELPWLAAYQAAGRKALSAYLGTALEQDYAELNAILAAFRRGDSPVWLKRMGRTEEARWYDAVDFSEVSVLILEWTHGGNPALRGVDIPVFLNSTPEETREHRRKRARDGKTDSAFTTMVLEIEQEELRRAAPKARFILSKAGQFLRPEDI